MASHIRLRTRQFEKFCHLAKWTTNAERAKHIGVNESTVARILAGKTAPGETFIAGVLTAFPALEFADLFDVIADPTDGENVA